MDTKGLYIYGIVPNFYSTDMFRSLDNSKVYTIPYKNISAIVSDWNGSDLASFDRESLGKLLVHHQKTIEDLQSKEFNLFIPMRIGTIKESKEAVIKVLSEGYNLIFDSLKKAEHLIEIDIVVSWASFGQILKGIAEDPAVIALKERVLTHSEAITQVDQVMVGMLVQEKLDEKNKLMELAILDSLSTVSLDIRTHEVMNDEMIINSAFLIHKNKREKFEQLIDLLDTTHDGMLNFKLVGPLPCYSFYTLEVVDLNAEIVEKARLDLELPHAISEVDIKKAYIAKSKIFHPDTQIENSDGKKFNNIQKAYQTLRDYVAAFRQSSSEVVLSLEKNHVAQNLTLVKIKD